MKPETIVKIYGKYDATYQGPARKAGRHKVVVLEGPDKGRTITVPGERLNK